jgi:hypothetical protein
MFRLISIPLHISLIYWMNMEPSSEDEIKLCRSAESDNVMTFPKCTKYSIYSQVNSDCYYWR